MKDWLCENCQRWLSHYGVARHRKMHRDRHDGPVIVTNLFYRFTYDYRTESEDSEARR